MTWKVLYTYKTGIFVQVIVPIKWRLEFTFDHYLTSAWKVNLPLDFEGANFLFLNVCYFVDNMHEQFGEAPREVFWSFTATAGHSWGSLCLWWACSSRNFHNLILQERKTMDAQMSFCEVCKISQKRPIFGWRRGSLAPLTHPLLKTTGLVLFRQVTALLHKGLDRKRTR